MTRLGRIALALFLLGAAAHAQEDDDDPKSMPKRPTATKSAKPAAATAPAASTEKPKSAEAPAAKPKPTDTPAAAPAAKPKPAEAAAPAPAPTPKAAKTDPAVAKKPRTDEPARKTVEEPEPPPVVARRSDEPSRKAADDPRKADAKHPVVASAEPKASASPPVEMPAPANARPVRVRLLDGSTVVGSVRAEQAEQLVIDCALGQLSIPRARISTIAYDAAAGVGKRAPVQLLDDGDTLPKKKSAQ
jgi:hypothetical protein